MTDEELGGIHEQTVSLLTMMMGNEPSQMLDTYRRMSDDMRSEMSDDNIMELCAGCEALVITFRKAVKPMDVEGALVFTIVTALVVIRNANRIKLERDAGGHGTEANDIE